MARNELRLSAEEQAVVENALSKPIWGFPQFTDYFCRDEYTGSWFSREDDEYMYDVPLRYEVDGTPVQGTSMYTYLHGLWRFSGKPTEYLVGEPPAFMRYYVERRDIPYIQYKVSFDDEGYPVFFWEHGWLPLRWGAWMHYAKQPNHVVLGGYGASKTAHVGMSAFVHCATVPRFVFVCIAAVQSQAKPMYEEVKTNVEGTKAEMFVARAASGQLRMSEKPNPAIHFKNGSSMLFLGAKEDLNKIRSLTADWVALEQAESHSALDDVKRELGSRRRGRVRGRKRMGRMTFVANSGESPELWEQFDKAEDEPSRYYSISLSSYQNPWLTRENIITYEKDVCGNDPDEIAQYMLGMKPVGRYKDFPKHVVEGCQSVELDAIMAVQKETGDGQEVVQTGCGHTLWSLAPQDNRDYAVYGDPGTKDPPGRGAGVVIVTDETGFPERPAEIIHFEWVAGGGKIGPFINAFSDALIRYGAQGRAYFEGTADQKNMNETVFEEKGLIVEPINMSGGLKHGMIIKLLRILERRMLIWAKAVAPIRIQLSKYNEEEDGRSSKLPQDIVTTLMIIASQLGPRMIEPGEIKRKRDIVRHAIRSGGYVRLTRSGKRAHR